MSLAVKGSRTITVDETTYRWAVSPDSGYDVLVVQGAGGKGAKLFTAIDNTDARYTSANDNGIFAITPALVTSIIRQARENGWNPNKTGPDIRCRLKPDESIEIRSLS